MIVLGDYTSPLILDKVLSKFLMSSLGLFEEPLDSNDAAAETCGKGVDVRGNEYGGNRWAVLE